jgi:hypothetical protein
MGKMNEVQQDIDNLLDEGVDCSTIATTLNIPLDWVVARYEDLADVEPADEAGEVSTYQEYQDLYDGDDQFQYAGNDYE